MHAGFQIVDEQEVGVHINADDYFLLSGNLETCIHNESRRRFRNVEQIGNRLRVAMRTPVSKCISKRKPISVYHAEDGIRFYYCLETGSQHFLDAYFLFHQILGTGVHYFIDASF